MLEADLKWGLSVEERNRDAGRELFAKLAAVGVRPTSVLEVGCGIGTMLATAEEYGASAVGFDVNNLATAYGRSRGRDTRDELWSPETPIGKPDLILCMSVLEHLDHPRPLIRDLCLGAQKFSSVLFISVPFLDRTRWPFLLDPDPKRSGTPFFDNDVHVTHFSSKGLTKAIEEFGILNVRPFAGGIWQGLLRFLEASGRSPEGSSFASPSQFTLWCVTLTFAARSSPSTASHASSGTPSTGRSFDGPDELAASTISSNPIVAAQRTPCAIEDTGSRRRGASNGRSAPA